MYTPLTPYYKLKNEPQTFFSSSQNLTRGLNPMLTFVQLLQSCGYMLATQAGKPSLNDTFPR